MREFIIRQGKLISPVNGYHGEVKDILVRDGKIEKIADRIEYEGEQIDAEGCIVTPGFIDIHTHCYPKAFLGLEPDVLGIQRGNDRDTRRGQQRSGQLRGLPAQLY